MYWNGLEYVALLLLIIAAGFLVRWFLAVKALREDAITEFAMREKDKPSSISGLDVSQFSRVYVDAHQPRGPLYAAAGLMAALITSPFAMLLVAALYDVIWRMNGAPTWGGRTGYVYMFSLFFGIVFCWALVAGVFARFYHVRTPEPFSHALARARGEPIPEDSGWRARPKWARRVRPDTDSPVDTEEGSDKEETA